MSYYISNLKDKLFGNNSNNNEDINNSNNNSKPNIGGGNGSSDITFRSELYQSVDKVRVLVIGDTAVGKSSIIHLICNNEVLTRSPSWTVGCNTDVLIHEYHSKDYYIEFVDVGGASKYKITRPILYHQISGIIVVYDLSNKISLTNVKKWIFDVLNKISTQTSNWKLKETESNQILELENTTESSKFNNNNNTNNNISNISSPLTSNTTSSTTTSTTPTNRRLNFMNSHSPTNQNFESSINITNSIRPTFLSQTSLFLPNNNNSGQPPATTPPINNIKNKSNHNHNNINNTTNNKSSFNNIPVLIMGNKSDLFFDKQFIENDSLGKLSILVSAKSSSTFTGSPHNSSRLEIFYNKMIANLISNKRGGNPTHMSFNTQIYNQLLNSNNIPNIPPPTSSSPIYTNSNENESIININNYSPPLFNQNNNNYVNQFLSPNLIQPSQSTSISINNNKGNKTPLRSRSTSFERSAKKF